MNNMKTQRKNLVLVIGGLAAVYCTLCLIMSFINS